MELDKKVLAKYPRACLKSKQDCLEYLEENKGKMSLIDSEGFSDDEITELKDILSSSVITEVYEKLGRFLSIQKATFQGIFFREDCLEYLINNGIATDKAVEITENIRKGKWKNNRDNTLPDEFWEWATGVSYLASRRNIFEGFRI